MSDHTQRAHALLSASSAHRWLNCPPSATATPTTPPTTTDYAEQGTIAHEIAEYKLRTLYGEQPDPPTGPTTQRWYDDEMDTHTTNYTNFVADAHRTAGMNATLDIETRTEIAYVQDGFGTIDAAITAPGYLHIIDLKYGRGQKVSPTENPQLMLYAAGLIHDRSLHSHIDTVDLTIYQPRLANIATWTTTKDNIITWAVTVAAPTAQLAYHGNGHKRAGDWCRYCPIAGSCTTQATHLISTLNQELGLPTDLQAEDLTQDQLAQILDATTEVKKWLDQVAKVATARAELGQKIPGFKLVEARTIRKITDPASAIAALEHAGFDHDKVCDVKLKTITALEKTVGKKQLADILGDLIHKPHGGTVLAPESDTREEIQVEPP